jgi:peptidoglycan/LPS O-acetylase OafA/YrhL
VAITLFGSIALPSGQLLPAPSLALVAGNFLMLQSIFCPSIPQDGALWSLSIEWWLYMLAPLLIRIDNRFTVLLGIISFSAMCLIFKENVLPDPGVHRIYLYLLAWPWLFGFAYFRNPASILNAILLFIPPLIFFEMFIHLHLASILLVVTAMSLHFAPRFRIGGETVKRVMNWSGDASFPLYLMHGPLLFALTSFTPIRNGNVLVGVVLLLVCVGYWCSRRGWSLIAASSSVPTASFWRRYRPARATVVAP